VNHNTEHHPDDYSEQSQAKLPTSATVHCLAGCGLGEVVGVVIGVALGLTTVATIVLAVILGFLFGFALGLIPLLRARFSLRWAVKQVLVAETLSIAVMETAEVLVEVYTPGVMDTGLSSPLFWRDCCWRSRRAFLRPFLSTTSWWAWESDTITSGAGAFQHRLDLAR